MGKNHFEHLGDDVRNAPTAEKSSSRRRRIARAGMPETVQPVQVREKRARQEPWDEHEHEHVDDMSGRFTDAATALRFMRAGNATVTLRSLRTGTRFTYRLRESEDSGCLFVALLNGPSNDSDYKYIGRISRDIFWAGRKEPRPGDIAKNAPSVVAFAWSWRELLQGTMPNALEVWHEGRCGRCGRKLTVPASIAAGFGPECEGKL